MHKSKQLVALLVALTMLFTASAFVSAAQTPAAEEVSVERVREIETLRQTNSETYLMSDGTYECVVYAGDKYYEDEADALQLIDNTITAVAASSSRAGDYKNTANAFDVYFSGSGVPEVTMQYSGSSLTFSPINTSAGTLNRIDADDQVVAIGAIDNCAVLNSLTPTGDNTVTYSEAFTDTDLVYVLENQMLKEYIILNSANAPNTFSFMFSLEGLTVQTLGGVTCFVDENEAPVFSLTSLYAVDSNGAFTEAVTYTCIPVKDTGNVIISITLAEEYLSSAQRAYPVVIDPSLLISSIDTADAYVSSSNPDTNYNANTYLRTGKDDPYGIRRSYIKFEIPSIITEDSLISASLDLEKASGVAPAVTAYSCAFAWNSSTLTWNNQPSYYSSYKSTVSTPRTSGSSWYSMDVTDIVHSWVSGIFTNHGFMLKDSTESSTSHWTTFYSSDAVSPHKPELHIQYIGSMTLTDVPTNLTSTDKHSCIPCAITNIAAYWSVNGYSQFDCATAAKQESVALQVHAAMENAGSAKANANIYAGYNIFTHESGGTTYGLSSVHYWRSSTPFSYLMIIEEIKAGRPAMLGFAATSDSLYSSGHMTVCAGYERDDSSGYVTEYVYISDAHRNYLRRVEFKLDTYNDFLAKVYIVSK